MGQKPAMTGVEGPPQTAANQKNPAPRSLMLFGPSFKLGWCWWNFFSRSAQDVHFVCLVVFGVWVTWWLCPVLFVGLRGGVCIAWWVGAQAADRRNSRKSSEATKAAQQYWVRQRNFSLVSRSLCLPYLSKAMLLN